MSMVSHLHVLRTLLLIALFPSTIVCAVELPPPAFSDKTFAENVDHKNNYCDLAEQLQTGSVLIRDALKGRAVSVIFPEPDGYALKVQKGFFDVTEGKALTEKGVMTEILDEVARRAGFEWRNSYGFFAWPKAGENFTWTDSLLWSAKTFDVTIEWWGETVERKSKGITYPQGFYDASAIFVTKSMISSDGDFVSMAFSWLRPFTWELWLLVLVLWVWCGVVYYTIEQMGHCRNKAEFPYDTRAENILLSIQHTSLEWAGGKWHTPKTMSGRFFAMAWLFARLLIMAAYTANLASTFVQSSLLTYTVNSMEEAVAAKYPVCMSVGTFLGEEMSRMFPDARWVPADGADLFNYLRDGKCAAVISDHDNWRLWKLKPEQNPGCSFQYVGRPLLQVALNPNRRLCDLFFVRCCVICPIFSCRARGDASLA